MKRSLVLGLLALFAVCGCQVKEEGEFAPEGKSFTATMEAIVGDATDIGTKTSLDHLNVLWKQGDQVSIFAGSTINERYQVTDASDGRTSASMYQVASPGFVAGGEIPVNVAFYPFAPDAEIVKSGSNYVISGIVLPATQNYASASFGNGAFPMAAITSSQSDYSLKFKNILGSLKLQLKGTAEIASISVTGNNGELLCGEATVTVSYAGTPSITLDDPDGTTVTLDCGNGVQLNAETATAFIIALPPMTMAGGFTVVVTDTDGASMEIKTTKSQTIARSNLLKMPAVTYVGTAPVVTPDPEAVDLGLPSGMKWASFNLGAAAPEDYGDYFAWGETEPYYEAGHSRDNPCTNWKDGKSAGYACSTYKWCEGSESSMTKYSAADNKMVLDPGDDAAYVNWGGNWRMPTEEEWNELISNCSWVWTTRNGVNGQLGTSRINSNSIFLPAAGYRQTTYFYYAGSTGSYWSSTVNAETNSLARYADFYSANIRGAYISRYYGLPVRPVSDEDVIYVTGVSLNTGSIDLVEGGTASLTATVTPSNATRPAVNWSSSDTSVASVDANGAVTAQGEGSATITATTVDGGFTATCVVTVEPIPVPEAVDLGLPSHLKWATFNVGAAAPEDYGDYFAWGETSPKSDYSWSTYQFELGTGANGPFSKYVNDSYYGNVDNKMVLDLEDDAAYVNWGEDWRMPTEEEWNELIFNCSWTWTTLNGVNGYLVTGTNQNSIFLPEAQSCDSIVHTSGTGGNYWSSSLYKNYPALAWYVYFNSNENDRTLVMRCYGFSVRPVLR